MKNWIGNEYGKLKVISELPKVKGLGTMVECLCECGNRKAILAKQLTQGGHKSCGCSKYCRVKESNHPLYQIWRGMKGRCYYLKNDSYKWYGGAGVTVCDLWKKSYVSFKNWCLTNGWQRGMQVDKDIIPKRLGIPALLYSPEMCSIVTATDNKRQSSRVKLTVNLANEIRISELPPHEISAKFNIHKSSIWRIKNNKSWIN